MDDRAVDALRVAMRRDKTLNLLEGCAPATAELSRWVHEICAKPAQRLFVAGDGGTGTNADFVPPGFALGELIGANAKAVTARWGPELRRVIETACGPNGAWPPTEPLTYVTGKVRCGVRGFLRDAVDRRGGTLLQVRGRDAGARGVPRKCEVPRVEGSNVLSARPAVHRVRAMELRGMRRRVRRRGGRGGVGGANRPARRVHRL